MAAETFLVRTMSDTVETDIQRVHVIANEILPRYDLAPLSFEQLRKIADGPFDLFLIPLIFADEYAKDHNLAFNEAKRVEIRRIALEIARKHSYDVNPPEFISGIDESLKETKAAGLRNVLMTTGGQRYKHQAMQSRHWRLFRGDHRPRGNYYAKEQGLYHLYRKHVAKHMRIILLSGTASYLKAGNNAHGCKVGDTFLEVVPIALSTEHSYNDEAALRAAQPTALIHSYGELLPALKNLAPLG